MSGYPMARLLLGAAQTLGAGVAAGGAVVVALAFARGGEPPAPEATGLAVEILRAAGGAHPVAAGLVLLVAGFILMANAQLGHAMVDTASNTAALLSRLSREGANGDGEDRLAAPVRAPRAAAGAEPPERRGAERIEPELRPFPRRAPS